MSAKISRARVQHHNVVRGKYPNASQRRQRATFRSSQFARVRHPDTSVARKKLMCKVEPCNAKRVNLIGAELIYSLMTQLICIGHV